MKMLSSLQSDRSIANQAVHNYVALFKLTSNFWFKHLFRTYYFGVRFVSQSIYAGDCIDDECEDDVDKLSGLALRNMTQDVEKIAQHIQGKKG